MRKTRSAKSQSLAEFPLKQNIETSATTKHLEHLIHLDNDTALIQGDQVDSFAVEDQVVVALRGQTGVDDVFHFQPVASADSAAGLSECQLLEPQLNCRSVTVDEPTAA